MGHNSGTQKPSDPMPRHPHLFQRNGRWYYRKRIPTDLVEAGCYGRKKEIKKALGTSDLATAKRLAQTVALELEEEFQAKRRELATLSPVATIANSLPSRSLADLTDLERRDFILRSFLRREKQASELRTAQVDQEELEEILTEVRGDLEAMEQSEPGEWKGKLVAELKAAGVSCEGANEVLLTQLSDKLKRAAIEVACRPERSGGKHDE